jgi:outer membrane protein assembly factor BamA
MHIPRTLVGIIYGAVFLSVCCSSSAIANTKVAEVEEHHDLTSQAAEVLPAIPDFARYKPVQPEELLEDKREGRFIIPVPQVGVDPDVGFVLGMGVTFFDNGSKESPFFRITPYRQRITLVGVASSEGLFELDANLDQPNIFDSPWRVRGSLSALRNPSSNYYGIGSEGINLTFPGSPRVYGSNSDYEYALGAESGGRAYTRYDQYNKHQLLIQGSAEYDLVGGLLRPLFGFQIGHYWVKDYTGDQVDARNAAGQSVRAIQEPTHLRDDCQSGRAIGCSGGYDVYVKLGLTLDTRNYEPDPSSGLFFQVTSELSPKFLGSTYNYGRISTSFAAYGNILNWKSQQLILAARVFYSWQFGDVPFYSMNTMASNADDRQGLGGFYSIRGFKQDRFIGPATMLTNAEIRWYFKKFKVWNQRMKLGVAPFIDAGRAFDSVGETSFRDWKIGGGVGVRLAWNLSTVICFDYGMTSEGSLFYMNAGLPF